MWSIEVEQKNHFSSGTEYTQTISLEFNSYDDALRFYDLALMGCKDAIVTMTMKGSNIKVEGEE